MGLPCFLYRFRGILTANTVFVANHALRYLSSMFWRELSSHLMCNYNTIHSWRQP
jgi:hypothetical protein